MFGEIAQFFNGDGGYNYRLQAESAFQNKNYLQWILLSTDGILEYTLDIALVPTAIITSKIDTFCQETLGLGLTEMAGNLQAHQLLKPAGEALYHFSNWARSTAAANGTAFVSTATNVGVGTLNQAAGLVGINGNSVKLNAGQQGKHIKGHNNYTPGKSILYGNLDDAQGLLNEYAGTGQKINEHKERVNFGKTIGLWVGNDTSYETTWGIIHYGKNGAHIVPANPQ